MEQQQPPQQNNQEPLPTNVGYIPMNKWDTDPMMSKHLDASDMLIKLKYMLLGYDYNDEEEEYQPVMVTIGYDNEGKAIKEEGRPLMPERTIRTIISSLGMYLSPNTFLSVLDEDSRNDIMYGVCQNLSIIWFRLRNKIRPEERSLIHSSIKDAIFLGLSRANKKMTLDAVSKTQQSHEIIQATPQQPQQRKDDFKVLNW